MKLSKSKLQQIIKEELMDILEGGGLLGKIIGKSGFVASPAWTIVGATDEKGKHAGITAKHDTKTIKGKPILIPLTPKSSDPSSTEVTITGDTSNTFYDPTTPNGEKALKLALDKFAQTIK